MLVNRKWAAILGVFAAMLAYGLTDTPEFVPDWARWVMGMMNMGLAAAGGMTHQGIKNGNGKKPPT